MRRWGSTEVAGRPFLRRSGQAFQRDGQEVEPVAFMHPCCADGCDQWGAFGFGVNLLRGKPGMWACADHRHLMDAPPTEKRDDPPGDLFSMEYLP